MPIDSSDQHDQMTLFGVPEAPAPSAPEAQPAPPAPTPTTTVSKAGRVGTRKKTPAKPEPPPVQRPRSGLVPEGDVRLTANIREDLHLRLKIAAAKQRTTIGEIIEALVEKYV